MQTELGSKKDNPAGTIYGYSLYEITDNEPI